MKLTDKITKYMESNRIKSLADFARAANLPYTTVKNIFVKDNINIKVETLTKLKNVMQISLDALVDDNIDIDFEAIKNKKYIAGEVDVPENVVISIGRGGKRSIYTIDEKDAAVVDNLLERLAKKNE